MSGESTIDRLRRYLLIKQTFITQFKPLKIIHGLLPHSDGVRYDMIFENEEMLIVTIGVERPDLAIFSFLQNRELIYFDVIELDFFVEAFSKFINTDRNELEAN